MDDRELSEILRDDPFEHEEPSRYEEWLYGMLQLAFANIAGLTHAIEQLGKRIHEHESLHQAANVAAMRLPDTTKDEKPN